MGGGKSSVGKGGGGGAKAKPTQVISNAVTFVDDNTLDSQVDAVTHYKEWEKGLTGEEHHFVYKYTGSAYESFNEALRTKNPSEMKQDHKDMDKYMQSAMAKTVLDKPITVYRGSGAELLGGRSTVAEIQELVGATVSDKAYVSTSVSKKGTFTDAVAYKIIVPAGKGRGAYVRGISNHKTEKEFLLNKNTKFRILSVAHSHSLGRPVVTMQVEE